MYDEKVRRKALDYIEEGYNPSQIARMMGGRPSESIIRKWALGYEPEGKRVQPTYYSVEEKLRALERLAAGESYKDLAAELGCASTTVLTWRRLYRQGGEDALRTRIDRFAEARSARG